MDPYELALRKAIRKHERELSNMKRALAVHEAVLADLEIQRQTRETKESKGKRAAQSREA